MSSAKKLSETNARGRNGWFAAKTVTVEQHVPDKVWLNVYSKRPGEIAPIVLEMTVADALAVYACLGKAIKAHLLAKGATR
jgi:hypothetical protein